MKVIVSLEGHVDKDDDNVQAPESIHLAMLVEIKF